MAFTASWIAEFVLELVELDALDSPRSSASDSLVLGFKLDRSELMELVLIPFLLCASAARGSGNRKLASHLIGRFKISFSLLHRKRAERRRKGLLFSNSCASA
jgi:hypothetical protein